MGIFQPNIKKLEEKRNIKGLVKALDDKWYPVRKEAAEALYRLRDECSLEVWSYALGNDSDEVQRYAMTALSEMRDARALDLLMDFLRKGEKSGDAGRAIGAMGDTRAIGPLVEELSNEVSFARWGAAIALEKLGWYPEENNEASANYWIALGRWDECVHLGEVAVKPLIERFKEKARIWDIDGQIAVATALGRIGDPRAVEPLVSCLKDLEHQMGSCRISERGRYAELRQHIRDALAMVRHDEGSMRTLCYLLKSPDASLRGDAIHVLGKVKWDPHNWNNENVEYSFLYWLNQSNFSEISAIGRPSIELLIDVLNRMKPAYLERDEYNRVAIIIQTLHALLDKHNAWRQCDRLQTSALERIVSELSGPTIKDRRTIASFLIGLYNNGIGPIGDRLRSVALASRGRIIEPHVDHFDVSGSCAHHEDSGIGLDFPL